jgi:predicted DNA-binding ArsR family transcriptional regulator
MFTPRIVRSLKVYRLARLFWGLDVDENMLIDRLHYMIYVQEQIQNTPEDKVIEFLRKNGRCTFDDIKKGLGISNTELVSILKRGHDISTIKMDGKTYYFVNF